ncbi:MAG: hypothetical protein ACM3SS_01800 [Rhodospirillaceae bacterium]
MLARLQRILVVFFICILPVQAMAVAYIPISCESLHGVEAAARMPGGGAHAHEHAGAQAMDHAHDASYTGDASHGTDSHHANLCCHQFFSAVPSVHLVAPPQDFRVYGSSVSLPAPLHIPELPQRPPRA